MAEESARIANVDPNGVSVVSDKTAAMAKALYDLTKTKVMVGIPAEGASRSDGGAINNATIGYINEFGSPVNNIPPRPHLVPGVRAYINGPGQARLKAAALAALDASRMTGEPTREVKKAPKTPTLSELKNAPIVSTPNEAVTSQFNAMGLEAVSSVRAVITAGIPPPLKDATIAARQRKGHKGETPLIETGDYLRHITYVLRRK